MNGRTFLGIVLAILLALCVFSPVKYILVRTGALEYTDLGNYIDPEKVYDGTDALSSALNGIERGKARLTDIYINYTPFYAETVTALRSADVKINKPFSSLLTKALAVKDGGTASDIPSDGAEPAGAAETTAFDTAALPDGMTDGTSAGTPTENPDELSTDLPPENPAASESEPGGESTYLTEEGRHRIYTVTLDEPVTNSINGQTVEGFLDRAILISHEELDKRVQHQAAEVNRIAAIRPDLNFYVYLGTRFQECEAYDRYFPYEKNTKAQRDAFLDLLDDRIRYDYLEINSLQDRIDKIYRSDHHWTLYGAHCGYSDVIRMMAADSPELGEPREFTELHLVDGCEYFGSTARACGSCEWPDEYYFYSYDLPQYTTSPANDLPTKTKLYLNGRFSKDRNADHYQTQFTPKDQFTNREPENDRVLFILGDSFTYGTGYLIASHFKTTYIVNPSTLTADFNYTSFLEKNGVTDVLILLISDRLYGDVYNNTPLTNIVDR